MHYDSLTIGLPLFCLLFSGFAAFWFLKPLRCKILSKIFSAGVLIILAGVLYVVWGGFREYSSFKKDELSRQQAIKVLNTLKDTNELRDKLVKHLNENPNSAKGWYLLGRLDISQNRSQQALEAFAKAYALNSDDVAIKVNYASVLIETGEDKKGVKLLKDVLAQDPLQQDALAILAMYYFKDKKLKLAIKYWQNLLNTLPSESPEADAVRQAIAKAHSMQ